MSELDELYREFEKIIIHEDPLLVAGIMMAHALKIYKEVLPEKDFLMITEHILKSRLDIEELEKPTLN